MNIDDARAFGDQCFMLASVLAEGKRVTPPWASQHLGINRLAARVCDLRRAGYTIHTRRVEGRLYEYWMDVPSVKQV